MRALTNLVGRGIIRWGAWLGRQPLWVSIPMVLVYALLVGPLLFIPDFRHWYDELLNQAELEIGDELDARP